MCPPLNIQTEVTYLLLTVSSLPHKDILFARVSFILFRKPSLSAQQQQVINIEWEPLYLLEAWLSKYLPRAQGPRVEKGNGLSYGPSRPRSGQPGICAGQELLITIMFISIFTRNG